MKDIRQLACSYFPEMDESQIHKLELLRPVYEQWNQRLNLISRSDFTYLEVRHILHSLSVGKVVTFAPGSRILDVGTGGGFPGIPLAILFSDSEFFLVDSIRKKVQAVQSIIGELGLTNVIVINTRAENISDKFDFVLSRAVTRLSRFMQWTKDNVREGTNSSIGNGTLCLKGGDLREELKELHMRAQIFELSQYFAEDFFETKKLVYIPISTS